MLLGLSSRNSDKLPVYVSGYTLSLSLGSIHPLGSIYYRIFIDTIIIDKELISYLRTEE